MNHTQHASVFVNSLVLCMFCYQNFMYKQNTNEKNGMQNSARQSVWPFAMTFR